MNTLQKYCILLLYIFQISLSSSLVLADDAFLSNRDQELFSFITMEDAPQWCDKIGRNFSKYRQFRYTLFGTACTFANGTVSTPTINWSKDQCIASARYASFNYLRPYSTQADYAFFAKCSGLKPNVPNSLADGLCKGGIARNYISGGNASLGEEVANTFGWQNLNLDGEQSDTVTETGASEYHGYYQLSNALQGAINDEKPSQTALIGAIEQQCKDTAPAPNLPVKVFSVATEWSNSMFGQNSPQWEYKRLYLNAICCYQKCPINKEWDGQQCIDPYRSGS